MRLKEALEQVEREHPELTGTAKIEAVKALRDADRRERASTAPAKARLASTPTGASRVLGFVALCQLAAVVVAVVAWATGWHPEGAGLVGVLVVWPALIHTHWLGLLCAVVALLVVWLMSVGATADAEHTEA
ncbi:hypothetical protein ACIQU5_31985 [Streptomyces sp. NPDC090306]|uniref:hypothetical protein n=1 Tax=Streptomyces sp. NPDC090306 TaxID=3365961 RepID=UPI00381ABDDC